MSLSTDLKSINCTACGAGLDVLGGGRVTTHICSYCGTELDALDSYRALRKFNDLTRPDTPFPIGTSGTLFGAGFVVIGILEQVETWGAETWKWVEHQLYSPTHGYAWLTLENGHLVFTRRYRKAGWVSDRTVNSSENRPRISADGTVYRYYETTKSRISFAEGEFTWQPKIGTKSSTISVLSDDAMLEFSQDSTERETYRSVYVPRDVAEDAFGIKIAVATQDVHPLQPFNSGPNFDFITRAAALFAAVSVVLALVFWSWPGETVLPRQDIRASDLPADIKFEIKDPGKMTRLYLGSDANNSWAYIEAEVADPEDVPLFGVGRTIEFYQGRDADGSWSEGSRSTRINFRPEQSGVYTLSLEVPETGTGETAVTAGERMAISLVTAEIRAGFANGVWMILAALGFGGVLILTAGRRALHQHRRWAGSDWEDEDD